MEWKHFEGDVVLTVVARRKNAGKMPALPIALMQDRIPLERIDRADMGRSVPSSRALRVNLRPYTDVPRLMKAAKRLKIGWVRGA